MDGSLNSSMEERVERINGIEILTGTVNNPPSSASHSSKKSRLQKLQTSTWEITTRWLP